jgi:enoyl-CoA hydratase/3-hydroxyacyl-CoA dehydrogenase
MKCIGIVGAGNMGTGIAQKYATCGIRVILADTSEASALRGLGNIKRTLDTAVDKGVFSQETAVDILSRISATGDLSDLKASDLVIEAVFEEIEVKRSLIAELEKICRSTTIIASNTSSFRISDLAAAAEHPGRIIGLHYFYHPAMNALVEVIGGDRTDQCILEKAWALQRLLGKVPIRSADACGFVVNRFFVPWLNEAVRILEEGFADVATIDAAAKHQFGIGMGPFELMNVTGVPIAMHSANTLATVFGPMYEPASRLVDQVESDAKWDLDGEADRSKFDAVTDRLMGVVFLVASHLVDEDIGIIEDVDIGARVGLRWPMGPFELMNHVGTERASELANSCAQQYSLVVPKLLSGKAECGQPFLLKVVRTDIRGSIATITIDRPDALNALNELVMSQLEEQFDAVVNDDAVLGIVIEGSGKVFVAGADIRFFVDNIEASTIDKIVDFTRHGQCLLQKIDDSTKPVIAKLSGLALGGGLELALACDCIIAANETVVGFPETGIGIYPALGGIQRSCRRIGVGLAKHIIGTGEKLSAAEALSIGLIDESVPITELETAVLTAMAEWVNDGGRTKRATVIPQKYQSISDHFVRLDIGNANDGVSTGDLGPEVTAAIAKLTGKAPLALRVVNTLIHQGVERSLREGIALELDYLPQIFRSEDAHKGLKSGGRRSVQFEGR